MKNYILKSSKIDPVKIWASEDGTYRIFKRKNTGYVLKSYDLFDMMGTELGEFDTLEDAMNF